MRVRGVGEERGVSVKVGLSIGSLGYSRNRGFGRLVFGIGRAVVDGEGAG